MVQASDGLSAISGDLRLLFLSRHQLTTASVLRAKNDFELQRELPDNPLLHFASFQRGEESGFAYFFKLFYKPLLQYAIGLLANEPAAEDIVEESFIKLWEKRTAVQSAASVKPYLYAIVRNACLDYLKKNKSEAAAKKDMEGLTEHATDPLRETITLPEIHLNIEAVLVQLPPRKRQIFSMFHLHHKSIEQIASELNLSAGSVKNQKSRALELLRLYFTGMPGRKA